MQTLELLGVDVPQILPGLVGASAALRATADDVPLIAETDATCLLQGETGTGKEIFARAIHYMSARRHGPFVPVNCGAIADSLFENELFGHARGAYTGADAQEIGLLAYAEHGTLFLDEVDALTSAAQVKLLRVIQQREYRPVGCARTLRADVRIVAATNCDLRERTLERRFREDLFHRINVLRLRVLPLRERLEDIPHLAVYFGRAFMERHRRPVRAIESQAMERLMSYTWPGNVRELEGVLERAVLLARRSSIHAGDLDIPGSIADASAPRTLTAAKILAIRQFERSYLSDVLHRFDGNVSRAARAAGKERRSFQRLLRKHQIAAAPFRAH